MARLQTDRIGTDLERHATFRDGEVIVAQGDPGRDMFVVVRGAVRIKTTGDDGSTTDLGTLQRGQFFGEMSVLESLPRAATAVAVGDVDLLVIGQGGLLARIRRDPSFALELLQQLSGRLRALNHRVTTNDGPA